MSYLLLDASVWLAALDPDDRYHATAKALVQSTTQDTDTGAEETPSETPPADTGLVTLAALDLTLYEVANIAVVSWRSQADAERLTELIRLACPTTLDRVDEQRIRDAARIATEHNLTVYDAAYVAAARKHNWTLVSCDLKDLVRPGFAIAPDTTPPPTPPKSDR